MLTDSPWLNFEKTTWLKAPSELHCEVAIVGGGISGVATLYYILTMTDKNVVLLEKNRVASGATGHNAGLAVVHIEKPASELVELLGKEATQTFFNELNEAWDDLHAIHEEIGLQDNLLSFPSVANGFNSLDQFLDLMKDFLIRSEYIQIQWRFLVAEGLREEIPEEFAAAVELVPQEDILDLLHSNDSSYIAAAQPRSPFKGKRMNSAKFCYKVLDYLKGRYPHRLFVYEQCDISRVDLFQDHVALQHAQGTVNAEEVVLCTNGYKNFTIWDRIHEKPYTKLHDNISPRIGYLAAFPGDAQESYAVGFLNQQGPYQDVPFWYFSYAPHPNDNPDHACVIGGPEFDLTQWKVSKGAESLDLVKQFLKSTLNDAPDTFPYFWSGWMGYSSDGMRWVGPDTQYPHLWYNLACNGIGIVPAIAGAKKIASTMKK